jgi:hypothetical protein
MNIEQKCQMYEDTLKAIAREFNSRRGSDEPELGIAGVYLAVVEALCELDNLRQLPEI